MFLSVPQSFLSKPHFLDGDPGLVSNITGVRGPVRELDDTVIDVEPVSVNTIGM